MENPTSLVCEICMKPQSSSSGLKQHIRRIHKKVSLLPIQCRLCEKILRDEHTLKCHIKAVHEPKKFSCSYNSCNKSFSQVGILNAHLRTHDPNKLYQCNVCGISYKDKGYYLKHIQVHTSGTKPYECEICGKSYLQVSHLKDHMTIHTGDKPFKCELCEKTFRHSGSLREHTNSHKGLKLYKCVACAYSTSYRKNLIAHQKKHSSSNVLIVQQETESSNESRSLYREDNDSPLTILVNIQQTGSSQSDPELKELDIATCEVHNIVEIPCNLESVEVPTQVSPLSLLLSAAASEPNISECEQNTSDLKPSDEPSRPLDLSVSAQVCKNPESDILEFTSANSGRRRSVFLVEESDYEHQGDMTVVDPIKVTGVNKSS